MWRIRPYLRGLTNSYRKKWMSFYWEFVCQIFFVLFYFLLNQTQFISFIYLLAKIITDLSENSTFWHQTTFLPQNHWRKCCHQYDEEQQMTGRQVWSMMTYAISLRRGEITAILCMNCHLNLELFPNWSEHKRFNWFLHLSCTCTTASVHFC